MRFLLLIIPFSFSLCAEESGVIPKSINFVSTHWVQGKGTFRVISFNSEYEPCFIIENYEGGLHAGLTSSNKVCSVRVPSNEVVNINHDRSGGSWFEDFEWVDDGLSFASTPQRESLIVLLGYLSPLVIYPSVWKNRIVKWIYRLSLIITESRLKF